MDLCLKYNIITKEFKSIVCPIDEYGNFTEEVTDYKGLYFKDADPIITKHLKEKKRVLKEGVEEHQYPFCWRSDKPLMYKAMPNWFINVERHDIK